MNLGLLDTIAMGLLALVVVCVTEKKNKKISNKLELLGLVLTSLTWPSLRFGCLNSVSDEP